MCVHVCVCSVLTLYQFLNFTTYVIFTHSPEVARGSVQIPGEGRSLTCSTALLDVMQDYLMVALPKGSNRNPVVPLLELIECTRLSALVVIMLLLLQSGDVERNPGPVERGRW